MHVLGKQGRAPVLEDLVVCDRESGVYCVVDGMGGAHGGVESARRTADAVFDFLKRKSGDNDATLPFWMDPRRSHEENLLTNSLFFAERSVRSFNDAQTRGRKGGASAVIVQVDEDRAWSARVGTVLLSLIRGGQTVQTYGPELDQHVRTWNVPTQFIGQAKPIVPLVERFKVQTGDWVVLGTAGMSGTVLAGLASIQGSNSAAPDSARSERLQLFFESFEPKENVSGVILGLS